MLVTAMNPAIPLDPPAEWFTPPATMAKDAGCIVDPDGRIYGYLCHWGSILMDGTGDRWKAPRTKSGYAYAHTGDAVCSDGSVVKTANLGGDVGHAPPGEHGDPGRLGKLQDFYENTQTQLARVRYGEDANGVWFAGACWPTVTDLDIAKLRASARSGHWAALGDWRELSSGRPGYELVGACLVNVPGLKYARADKAASGVIHTMRPMGEPMNVAENIERIAASGTVEMAAAEESASVPLSGVLLVEGVATEDGRFIEPGAAEWRELPLPLYASLRNLPGHDEAELIGRIDAIARDEADPNIVRWDGVAFPDAADGYGAKVVQAVVDKTLKGVSIDGITGPEDAYVDDAELLIMSRIVVAGATLTPMPAFGEATVTISASANNGEFTMSTETLSCGDDDMLIEGDDTDDVVVVESQESDDQWQAVNEKLDTLAARLEHLIGLVESSQMTASMSAALARLGS